MTLDQTLGTSSAWADVHARSAALREIVTRLDAGESLPQDPANDPATAGAFADADDLLRALHETWSRRLQGRIDLALETDDHRLDESVARAWVASVDDLPGVRRVLDEHADEPALRQLERTEHRAVAVAAGLATFGDPIAHSATAGAQFVASLRGRRTEAGPRRSLLHRAWLVALG
jgi:hypothetical protein